MHHLRYALLFDGTSLEYWHLRCLEQLDQIAELAGVVVAPRRTAAGRAASPALRRYTRRVESRSRLDAAERFSDAPRLSFDRPPSPGAEPTLDFVLRLGSITTPVGIGSATRHGVWFFEHESAEGLPFLSELYDAREVTRAALAAIDEQGGATILQEGYFRTERRSYVAGRDRILESLAAWPARSARRLLSGTDDRPASREAPAPSSHPRPKRRGGLLRLGAIVARRRLGLARERLFRHPQWNIGVVNLDVGALLAPRALAGAEVDWFPVDDRRGFLADPFGVVGDSGVHVLCEQFDYRESKGRLCALDYSKGTFSAPVDAGLSLSGHVSYPFLVADESVVYCVPETADANEVALFRATPPPWRWSKVATLLAGFPGVDPTVFRHDGRWWLTCTRKGPLEDVELWAWHARELQGVWTAHESNPIKTDVRGARPGGTPFVRDGMLYRPAQDCSRTYGGRISLQRVTRLTPADFEEETAAILEWPAASRFPVGPHTLAAVGDVVLIDGRRSVFVGAALAAFLRIWAGELARTLRRG